MNTSPNAKRILCFGDSLTWGYKPATSHERIASIVRWTGKLQEKLGENYEIIEEGLNSRTLISDDDRPGKEGRNGSIYLIPCLDTHDPIDIVVFMLGTNELKDTFETPMSDVKNILEEKFVKIILGRKSQFSHKTPQLILVCPPKIDITKEYAFARYSKSIEKSIQLETIYNELSEKYKCPLIISSELVETGDDGVHITQESHYKLAERLNVVLHKF